MYMHIQAEAFSTCRAGCWALEPAGELRDARVCLVQHRMQGAALDSSHLLHEPCKPCELERKAAAPGAADTAGPLLARVKSSATSGAQRPADAPRKVT